MLMAVGISSLVFAALAQLTFFSGRSMVAMINYTDLDFWSNRALKLMSKEIRQANRLKTSTSTSLVFVDFDGADLTYSYDAFKQELVRIKGAKSQVLLKDCDQLQFSIFQRNPVMGAFNQYPVATPGTTKLVQVSWICSRQILGAKVNTESVQSAKFVIRKEQN
jgi:hypothetical protein